METVTDSSPALNARCRVRMEPLSSRASIAAESSGSASRLSARSLAAWASAGARTPPATWPPKPAFASSNLAPESSCDPMTQTTTDTEDFLTASMHHGNLQVDTTDPRPPLDDRHPGRQARPRRHLPRA